jgi:cold shock CspA family protein
MNEILYNILWIDDEHETLPGTKGRAKRKGINLIGYKSLNGGMDELERNYPFYDGVLLDAKFFENEEDTEGTEDTDNVHRAKERLLGLKKRFEVFVLTGHAEAYEDKTFNKAFPKVYQKGDNDVTDRLFNDIKEAAAGLEDTQVRHAYKRVFDVCTETYIGEYAGQDLLNLLKDTNESNVDNQFNAIRKIVEDLFSAFNKYNLLPSAFVTPNIALNESSKFLSGKNTFDDSYFEEKGYRHLDGTHLPEQISYCLRSILAVTQSGSHRSKLDVFVREVKTPYLMKSVLFQLMDVLVWFKIYVDSHPTIENWEKVAHDNAIDDDQPFIPGQVINFNQQKNFAFFKPDGFGDNVFIPPNLVTENALADGMKILAKTEEYIDNRTTETKIRVKRLELI